MATLYKPKIVTDGLVMCLDAANNKSLSGGTTWVDLSQNNNSGSLINGPTISNVGGGSVSFDGTNDYVLLPTNFFNHNAGTPFTVSMWFKTGATSSVLLGQQDIDTPAVATSYVPALYINTSGQLVTSCFWGGSTGNVSTSSVAITDNIWHNVTVTFSGSSHISYLDGQQFAILTKTQSTYASTYYYFLGSGTFLNWPGAGSSPYFGGSIANFMFYTRTLSSTEILQNFNATRNRFGV